MKPLFTKIDIPDDWTAEQAYAISDFIESIMSAIWEVHDQKIVDLIIKRNEMTKLTNRYDKHSLADDHRVSSRDPQPNDDDIPF